MKIKFLICSLAAFFLLCSAASADFLQIADEAAADGVPGAAEMLDYVYANGAAQNPKSEIRRLYIWNYLLEMEKQEAELTRDIYYSAYTDLNRNGELDYLAELADEQSRISGQLTDELNRGYAYLSLVEKSGPSVREAAGDAAKSVAAKTAKNASKAGSGATVVLLAAVCVLLAAVTTAVMICLGRIKRRGLRGRTLRDLRRCLLGGRGIILAAGLILAVGSSFLTLPYSFEQIPSLPETNGECLYAAEALLDYCDRLELKPGSTVAEKVENVKRYQLSSAMGEILNNKVAINLKEVKTHYQRLAEHQDSARHTGLARAQEMLKAAEEGSALSYLDQIKAYMEQEIQAGLAGVKADYYHNLVDLMNANVLVTPGAETRARAYIDDAKKVLTDILTVPPRPELPLLAALGGYGIGILAATVIVLLTGLIRFGIRRSGQGSRTDDLEGAETMEEVAFRG